MSDLKKDLFKWKLKTWSYSIGVIIIVAWVIYII